MKSCVFFFGENVNFITGPNGIGKTSILDAVCFALLGDIRATAIYQNLTYKDFIRNPERDMEISLTFCPHGEGEYTVVRTHATHSNRKGCMLSLDGTVLTKRWDEATSQILELYETNELFLRRVVLLSEGDTFAYSVQPPGEGLTKHIENILGINRMENLRANLGRLMREFDAEARGKKTEVETVRESTVEDKNRAEEITSQIEVLQKDRDEISGIIDTLNNQVGALTSDKRGVANLITEARSVVEEWTQAFGDPPQNYEFLGAIEALKQSLDDEKSSLLAQRDSLRDELTWLSAQIESQNKILEFVEPLEKEQKDVACPVCKRPLTPEMVMDIKNECLKILAEFGRRKKEQQKQLPIIDRTIQAEETKLRTLLAIDSKVRLVLEQEPRSLSIPVLESHLAEIAGQIDAGKGELEKLRGQVTEKSNEIRIIEQELTELRKRTDEKKRLTTIRSLTSAVKGQFVSELFLQSLVSVLTEQRRTLLEPLTEDLSEIWSAFLGMDVGVELEDDAQIKMFDKQTQSSLEFPQLSGGEKTALLIFTQILLCKYFSKAGFMMLDEPLEHLDVRNRWALIKFLVDTTKRGYPKQLIVTTFEETLLREYLDDAQIKISILSREHPLIEGI